MKNNKNTSIFLDVIVNNIPHYVFWKDKNSVFLGCNNLFAEAAGLDNPEDIVGKTDYDLPWGKTESDIYRADDREVIESAKAKLNIEEPQTNEHGEQIVLLTNKVPIFDENGEVIGVLGVYTDITERKKLEQKLVQASQEKTAFIATLNNTLRSPITTIAMMADMLRQTGLTAEQEQYVALLESANNSMPDDLTYASDYAKLDSGDMAIIPMSLRLLYSVETLNDRFYQPARDKGLEFIVDYTGLEDVWVSASLVELKETLQTLLDHCVHYTTAGYIRVSLHHSDVGREYTLLVEDTSPGFEGDYLARIFSEGGLAADYDTDYPLMSMRFAFCRKAMSVLGGSIRGESQPGQGARFYLTFRHSNVDPRDRLVDKEQANTLGTYQCAVIGESDLKTQAFISLFRPKAMHRFSPEDATAGIRQQLEDTGELDYVFIDQTLAESQPALVKAIMAELDPRFSLCLVLCDHNPSLSLAQLFDRYKHLGYLNRPFKWTRFHQSVVAKRSALEHRSLAVLVVEDDLIAQKAIQFVLEKQDCDVTLLSTGEQALARMDFDEDEDSYPNFDVIFLDIGLPGQSGLEVAKTLQQRLPYDCPPLIALTGYTRQVDLDVLYDSGLFFRIIPKPATAQQVANTLRELFDHQDES